ncbi:MAG: hypothetical protein C0518_09410 [Opitutus sp.]|nr:hypothetical protein [Opitutus sp.]
MRFLLALVVIGVAVYFITQRAPSPVARSTSENHTASATEPGRESARTTDRPLTADNLREDLSRTGETLREKARTAGEKIDDARVVAMIKGKFALDRDLSALDIKVTCEDGNVVLLGTVASESLANRAVELAKNTDGVANVQSQLNSGGR